MIENYADMIIKGYTPLCDRCSDLGIKSIVTIQDYYIHRKGEFMYCKPCWNYMDLRKYWCSCGARGTLRSELDILPKHCENLKKP